MNTYTGATTVDKGVLAVDNDGATTFGTLGSGPTTTNGATFNGGPVGTLRFQQSASAGSGTFTTNAGTVAGATGGITEFLDSSSAGSGIFTIKASKGCVQNDGVAVFRRPASLSPARPVL